MGLWRQRFRALRCENQKASGCAPLLDIGIEYKTLCQGSSAPGAALKRLDRFFDLAQPESELEDFSFSNWSIRSKALFN